MRPIELFNKIYNKISVAIAFDPAWANQTGYLDHVVKANLGLRPGEMATAVDNYGRRIVLVGTVLGNVAVFERWNSKEDDPCDTFVCNLPNGLGTFFGGMAGIGSSLEYAGMEFLIGNQYGALNIGQRFNTLQALFSKVA